MDRQKATNLFVSVRGPATSSYQLASSRTKCGPWRAQQPWSAHGPSGVGGLWTLPISYSWISFQKKHPDVVQHAALLADIPSRARPVEDSCPAGWTWLEAALSLKMCLQCLSPTLYHYSCAWPHAGFGTCLAGDDIPGTKHGDIWARIVTAMVMSRGEQVCRQPQKEPFVAVWLPGTIQNLLQAWTSSLMGQSIFFWSCWWKTG